jgi:hypothetical protein
MHYLYIPLTSRCVFVRVHLKWNTVTSRQKRLWDDETPASEWVENKEVRTRPRSTWKRRNQMVRLKSSNSNQPWRRRPPAPGWSSQWWSRLARNRQRPNAAGARRNTRETGGAGAKHEGDQWGGVPPPPKIVRVQSSSRAKDPEGDRRSWFCGSAHLVPMFFMGRPNNLLSRFIYFGH